MERVDPREFDASKTILDLQRILLEKNINIVAVRLIGLESPEKLMRLGFIPLFIKSRAERYDKNINSLNYYFVEGLSDQEVEFWHEGYSLHNLFKGEQEFIYANIEGWKDFAQKYAISLPLVLYAPDLVYKSLRPKTDMAIFRQPTSILYQRVMTNLDGYIKEILITDNRTMLAIPVTRYAKGMSRGLYHSKKDENKEDFCGTFYYYEPESTTYLTLLSRTVRVYGNKYNAITALYKEFGVGKDIPNMLGYSWKADEYLKHPEKFPEDLKMTPLEFVNTYSAPGDYDLEYMRTLPNRKHYVGVHLDLYSLEDVYDQDICTTAKENGIDIIILTHMVGRYQVVTEVLDTRERVISFSNLAYPLK